ncbi:hypothetical protein Tco_0337060 [Tanacetum coccineum]
MFDESPNVDLHAPEVIAPIPEAVTPEHAISTGSPSSTTVDQDAPTPSNSHTPQETQTPIISHDVEEDNHDIKKVAHMAMQEELHEFECLEVWELVPPPDKAFVISLKWIYKVKLDKLGGSTWLVMNVVTSFLYPMTSISKAQWITTLFMPTKIFSKSRRTSINSSKYALESIKKYANESLRPIGYSHGGEVQTDEIKKGKL